MNRWVGLWLLLGVLGACHARGELVCHELTLEQALPGGQSLVVLVGREGPAVRRLAATVPGQPAIIRISQHPEIAQDLVARRKTWQHATA
jgi:hypothetical protein